MSLRKLVFHFCLLGAVFISNTAMSSVYIQHSMSYQSELEESQFETFEYSNFRNTFFLGASLQKDGQFILGQSISHWSRSYDETSVVQSFDMLEVGPRVILYLNKGRNFYISGAYHFYASGDRKSTLAQNGSDEVSEKVSGSSILASIGLQRSIGGSLYLGFSINYHRFSASKSESSEVEVEIDDQFSGVYPSFELSYRF